MDPTQAAAPPETFLPDPEPSGPRRSYGGRHWTQDPKNRARVQELARRRALKAKAEPKRKYTKQPKPEPADGNQPGSPSETQVAYVYGRFQNFIEVFATSRGLSPAALAQRVGTLLRRGAGW